MKEIINYKAVFKVLSRSMIILSLALIFSMITALIYSESIRPFLFSFLIITFTGLLFYFIARAKTGGIGIERKEAYFTVTVSWLLMGLLGSLPYIFSGSIPHFIDAFFESTSGFTTTGSSILTDIEALPKSILFWRSLTHWIGGVGIIVLVIIVMPSLGMGSYNLFTLESSLQEKIHYRIVSTGKRILLIYFILTIAEVILLLIGGMNLFESICHAFGTIATGGFSPKNSSIGGYSPYIQYVVMIFMLLSGMNFVIHYSLYKLDFKRIKGNEELHLYLIVIFIAGSVITASLFFNMHKPLEESFRESFFQVISIVTCTGYATADYQLWPAYAWGLIFLCMFFGGSTGSTAGGIKMARHVILYKNIQYNIKRSFLSHAIIPLKYNNKSLSDENNRSILSFIFLYFIIFIGGTFLLVLTGLDAKTASSSAATCMAGIGPGLGSVGPAGNFSHLSDVAKLILSMLMLLGRLEIHTVIMLFSRKFWKA
jgi:trk system potassium uptake protein TrkH